MHEPPDENAAHDAVPSDAAGAPLKTPMQLIVAIFASFTIPVIVLIMLATYANHVFRNGAGTDALSDAAVAQRIAPVAQVTLDTTPQPAATVAASASAASGPSAAQAAAAAVAAVAAVPAQNAAPPAQAEAAGAPGAGKALFEATCQACHGTGLLGAPKFGNAADWAPRLKDPMPVIYNYALQGKGNMPPRGGSNASDADVKAAVDYMVNAAKQAAK